MNVENLGYFLSIAESSSFAETAEKSHISESSMSKRISRLEDELGTLLFVRAHHTVSLTAAGKILYDGLVSIRPVFESTVAQVRRTRFSQAINVCLFPSNAYPDLLHKISEYCSVHLETDVSLHVAHNIINVLDDLKRGDLDFCIIHQQPSGVATSAFDVDFLGNDYFCVTVPVSHPLASGAEIHLSDLKDEFFFTKPFYYDYLQRVCPELGLNATNSVTSVFLHDILSRVANGEGVTLAFEGDIQRMPSLASRRIKELPPAPIVLVSCKGETLTEGQRKFKEWLVSTLTSD